ncbi:hypothetical protein H7J50_04975 [Mycobacterium intermedium]|uniref:hypothetical protein n=1 Tax=Mycobacterium intermedium TaxID=28445 RepID=UPI000AFEC57C|nr:hypothetical protein [Mycobacterium intermedium]MCV6963163.1 hypothetical protein [Mycobacterium intermedium]
MELPLLRKRARPDTATVAAESWFLQRGLPSVLTRRARWRRLWSRSAPVLAAYAMLHCSGIPIYLITRGEDVNIVGTPSPTEWLLLALIAVAPIAIILAGWLVSRLPSGRARAIAATVAISVVATVILVQAGVAHLPQAAVAALIMLLLTASGLGSVLGWAIRMTLSHLATVGTLAVRALPVVLLTTLVFFNGNVWLMAAKISGERLLLALAFLVGIAVAFVVSSTVDRVRPMLRSPASVPKDSELLADTPFEPLPDPPDAPALTRAERVNVVFVLAVSQLAQIMVVAALTSAIYLVLGLIVLDANLLKEWAHTGVTSSTILGFTVPVPHSLIHMCLVLGALTFMYISARAAGDEEYRTSFLNPLMDDLHATLTARNRYRGTVARVAVDGGDSDDYLHPNAG